MIATYRFDEMHYLSSSMKTFNMVQTFGPDSTNKGFCQRESKLENVFMAHYAPNHMLAPKEGSNQKGV